MNTINIVFSKSFKLLSISFFFFFINGCDTSMKKNPDGFITTNSIKDNIDNSELEPKFIESDDLNRLVDSFIKADHPNSKQLIKKFHYPVSEIMDGIDSGKVFIDSTIIIGTVKLLKNRDTSYLVLTIEENKVVSSFMTER